MLIADSQQHILFEEYQALNKSEQYSEGVIAVFFERVSILFNIDIKSTNIIFMLMTANSIGMKKVLIFVNLIIIILINP